MLKKSYEREGKKKKKKKKKKGNLACTLTVFLPFQIFSMAANLTFPSESFSPFIPEVTISWYSLIHIRPLYPLNASIFSPNLTPCVGVPNTTSVPTTFSLDNGDPRSRLGCPPKLIFICLAQVRFLFLIPACICGCLLWSFLFLVDSKYVSLCWSYFAIASIISCLTTISHFFAPIMHSWTPISLHYLLSIEKCISLSFIVWICYYHYAFSFPSMTSIWF